MENVISIVLGKLNCWFQQSKFHIFHQEMIQNRVPGTQIYWLDIVFRFIPLINNESVFFVSS
ncbi:unnamed protein product [Heterobilharzia americana]|nr:unnamed protein product [Heterobilharzia americana]CAH8552444.1 unnamed protein product [Heterobilharzia americana]